MSVCVNFQCVLADVVIGMICGKQILYFVCLGNYFPGFKILVVRFVEFIFWLGECEEVIVVFVAEAGASLARTRGQ